MGPGFESQLDHLRKLNRKIGLSLFKDIRIRTEVLGSTISTSAMHAGNVCSTIFQLYTKKAQSQIGLFLYTMIHFMLTVS